MFLTCHSDDHTFVSAPSDAVTVVLFRLFSIFANRQFLSRNLDDIEELLEPSCHQLAYHGADKDDFIITATDVSSLTLYCGTSYFVCCCLGVFRFCSLCGCNCMQYSTGLFIWCYNLLHYQIHRTCTR